MGAPVAAPPSLLDAALALAAKGFYVFAASPKAKKAVLKGWQANATTDPAKLREEWSKARRWLASARNSERDPDVTEPRIGIACGGPDQLLVIDVDVDTAEGKDGRPLLAQLEAELGALPTTLTASTRRGGSHLYFRFPADLPPEAVRNAARGLGKDIDIRGGATRSGLAKGLVIAPPSPGYTYSVDAPVAELPRAWAERICAPRKAPSAPRPAPRPEMLLEAGTPRARRACATAIAKLRRSVKGERNDMLRDAAYTCAGFVAGGQIPEDGLKAEIVAAAMTVGLDDDGINALTATLEGSWTAGLASPLYPEARDQRRSAAVAQPAPAPAPSIPPPHLRAVAASEASAAAPLPFARGRQSSASAALALSPATRQLPEIEIIAGEIPRMVDEAEAALLSEIAHNPERAIYQRGADVVRVVRRERLTVTHGMKREPGALVIESCRMNSLAELFSLSATWMRFDARQQKLVRRDPPEKVAATYMERAHRKLPALAGTTEAPTLRHDGSILDRPGYDATTRLLFDPGSAEFLPVPDRPTKQDAAAAVAVFEELLIGERIGDGFPFVALSDFSVALSAILTALVRRSLRTAPLHAFRAPKAGTGKSLLADVVSLIATGRPCAVMSQGSDPNEEKKRWLAILAAGDPIVNIDNIERPLSGETLCSILTQESYQDRVLGVSEMVTVPTASTILATGNNLVFEGDLTRRVVLCDLDPKMERPEERTFKFDLRTEVPRRRAELVRAGLTILRAHHVAGRPCEALPLGSFEDWSQWVRAALLWLGQADPCEGRKRIEETDPERNQIRAFVATWRDAFGDRWITTADAIKEADSDLRAALIEIAGTRSGEVDPRRLGRWIGKHRNRIEGGCRIEGGTLRKGAPTWSVREVGS